jgi:DNA-binding response OmpR family regulator
MSIARRMDRVDLLVADTVMDDMSGRELAQWLCASQPGMKLLLTACDNDQPDMQAPDPVNGYLRKPYAPGALSRQVRATLDEAPPFAVSVPRAELAA